MRPGDATYRIDPIGPDQVQGRFLALIDRLAPALGADEAARLRSEVAAGAIGPAYARLDALTNDGSIMVETSTLVELVLLGQAINLA